MVAGSRCQLGDSFLEAPETQERHETPKVTVWYLDLAAYLDRRGE